VILNNVDDSQNQLQHCAGVRKTFALVTLMIQKYLNLLPLDRWSMARTQPHCLQHHSRTQTLHSNFIFYRFIPHFPWWSLSHHSCTAVLI
jgi:hypothetical protein